MALNPDKLNEFLGKAVVDFGATMSAGSHRIGDQLGLYKALAERWPADAGGAREANRHRRALRARVAQRAGRRRLRRRTTPHERQFSLTDEQAFALADETARRSCPARFSSRSRRAQGEPKITRSVQDRRGHRLARARPRPVRRHRAVLPSGLRRQPGRARGFPRWTASRPSSKRGAQGRRRRLRSRRVDDPDGAGVSELEVRRLRLPRRRRSKPRATARRRSRRRRSRALRGRRRRRSIPATTTTSSRSSIACTTWAIRSAPRRTCARSLTKDGTWMIVEPFADDRARGQPQSGRPRVLLGVDADLHAGVAARRKSALAPRRAGRREAASRRRDQRRVYAVSAARRRRRSTWSSRRGRKRKPLAGYARASWGAACCAPTRRRNDVRG